MNPITPAEALEIGIQLKVDWTKIDLEEFRLGLEVELNDRRIDHRSGSRAEDLLAVGKVILDRIVDTPGYYQRLGP